jgi:hypothetical protein
VSWRSGRGKGATRIVAEPRIEVRPADEQADPVPGEAVPLVFRSNGTIADSATARALGARGGRARAKGARTYAALGLAKLAADAAFAPYREAGDAFVREHLSALAMQSGGEVGPGPSSIVASAGVQLAASRYFSDRAAETGDAKQWAQASALADASRQNLLAAYELAVREAKARPRTVAEAQAAIAQRILGPAR